LIKKVGINNLGDIEKEFVSACNSNKTSTVKCLLNYISDSSIIFECFIYACNHVFDCIVYFLSKRVDINKKDIYGLTGFMYACENDSVDIVKILIEAGVNMEEVDNKGETGFIKTCWKSCLKTILLLIDEGVNVKHVTTDRLMGFSISYGKAYEYLSLKNLKKDGFTTCYQTDLEILKYILAAEPEHYNYCDENFDRLEYIIKYMNGNDFKLRRDFIMERRASKLFSSIVLISDGYYDIKTI